MALSGRGHSASACPVCLVPQASLCPHPEAPGRMVSQAPSSLVVVGVVRSHHLAVAMRFRHVRQLIREQSRQHILKTKNLLSRFSRSLGGGGGGGVGRGGEGRWVSRWGWGGQGLVGSPSLPLSNRMERNQATSLTVWPGGWETTLRGCVEQERALQALRDDLVRSRRNQTGKAREWARGSHRQGEWAKGGLLGAGSGGVGGAAAIPS